MWCICSDTLHLSPIYRGYIYLLPTLHKTESHRGSLNNSNAAFVDLRNLCERIVGFETADKMTDRQVAQKVRNFYAAAPAIPLTNGDQLKQS